MFLVREADREVPFCRNVGFAITINVYKTNNSTKIRSRPTTMQDKDLDLYNLYLKSEHNVDQLCISVLQSVCCYFAKLITFSKISSGFVLRHN